MDLRLARWLITFVAAFLAVVPPLADLNATHVTNPLWTGHARLHTVWLITTNSLIALLALGGLWRAGEPTRRQVRLSLVLTAAILAGFFVAAVTQFGYGGALTDENGVEGTTGGVDLDLAAFSFLAALLAIVAFGLRRRGDAGAH